MLYLKKDISPTVQARLSFHSEPTFLVCPIAWNSDGFEVCVQSLFSSTGQEYSGT